MHYQIERNHGCRVSDSWTYRGLKTAVLENELLRVVVLVDKGADIYQLVHKPTDVDFLWRSPWGVRDPSKFLPTTGSPTSMWLDVYEGGWQTVLPAGGFPSEVGGVELGLHAEVNTMPWDCQIVDDTPEKVSLRFWVRGVRMPFFCEKKLTLVSGSPVLEIEESIVNEGEEPAHCVWGQHIAIGEPFLSEDCVIDLPGGTLFNLSEKDWHPNNRLKAGATGQWPTTELKGGGDVDLSRLPSKSERFYDQSFITDMPEGWYAVTNQATGIGFGVVFPTDVFRYLWYWQSFHAQGYPWYGRTYNVGLEPFTSYANQGLQSAIENGTALRMEAGERVSASVKAVAYTGVERVKRIKPDGSVVKVS